MAGTRGLNMGTKFTQLDCNSKRLEQRFVQTMATLSRQPDKSIWFCGGNRAEAAEIILLIQDTTSLNYNTHKKTQGIGYVSDTTLGVNMHTGINS